MMFSRPLGEKNRSKSKPKPQAFGKGRASLTPEKTGLSFKGKVKPLVSVPALINLSETVVLAGGQTETFFEILPYEELFVEAGKRVVNCKIDVSNENIPNSFWLGDPKSENMYQSFDTCLMSSATKLRIVARCPEVQKTTEVIGTLELSFQGVERKVSIPVKMVCQVPKLVCLTNLENVNKGYSIIRLPVKNKALSSLIPFKNDSPMDLRLQVKLIGSQKEGPQKYDLLTPRLMTVKKGERFFLKLDLKENTGYEGPHPQIYTIRKVIQLRLPGCKQFFTFPLEVLVYETPQMI